MNDSSHFRHIFPAHFAMRPKSLRQAHERFCLVTETLLVVATVGDNLQENKAFVGLSQAFGAHA